MEAQRHRQIRVLISFHQFWMPAELKVNIWGFSKPSRCLESMDWLVLAAPLSVFVGRPGPISNVSQPYLSQQLPGQNQYILYYIPLIHSFPHHSRLYSFFLPSSSPSPLRWSRYVTLWALSRLVTHGVSYLWRLRKCLLRVKQRWVVIYDNTKDNCVLVLTGRFAIFFRNRCSQELSNGGNFFFWL